MGFPAICFSSEALPTKGDNALFVKVVLNELSRRYRYTLLLMDNDEAGKEASEKISATFGLKFIYPKYAKDISDAVVKTNFHRARKGLLKNIKQCLKSQN